MVAAGPLGDKVQGAYTPPWWFWSECFARSLMYTITRGSSRVGDDIIKYYINLFFFDIVIIQPRTIQHTQNKKKVFGMESKILIKCKNQKNPWQKGFALSSHV